MFTWILSLMISLAPSTPWRATYEATAHAIDTAVTADEPLFAGEDGRRKTAALLVSLAFYESTFRPDVEGDKGRSIGLYQVQPAFSERSREELLSSVDVQAREALRLLHVSERTCRALPLEDRLSAYAAGDCEHGVRQSRVRMNLARRLLRRGS